MLGKPTMLDVGMHLARRRAFSLIELMVSVTISGILFTAIFAFVYQFGGFFDQLISESKEQDPIDKLLSMLAADLAVTNAIEVKKLRKGLHVSYVVARRKREGSIIHGKEVTIKYNRPRGRIRVEESWFQWTFTQYVDNALKKRQPYSNIERELVLPEKTVLSFRSIYPSQDESEVPILFKVTVNTPDKKVSRLLPLGQL